MTDQKHTHKFYPIKLTLGWTPTAHWTCECGYLKDVIIKREKEQ